MTILDIPILSRLRRNHGLEHATLAILASRAAGRRMAGWSHPGGFLILGEVDAPELVQAVRVALGRLQQGESRLAVHPHCGTNLAVSAALAGLLAWLGLAGTHDRRSRLERLPLVMLLAAAGILAGSSLGPIIQKKVTTSGDPLSLTLDSVTSFSVGPLRLHHVATRD